MKFEGFSWNYPDKGFIGSPGRVWVNGLLYQVFIIQVFGVFVLLFFRKRLTIQEALSHPWITVRLSKEKDLVFFHEQNRDHILTLTGVLNGKLPPKYFVIDTG